MGNVFDRIVSGAVTDFLDFYVGGLHWPAFNVADSAIVIGSGLLLISLLRPKQQTARAPDMLPYVFSIGGFHLPTYGLLVALAFLIALALTARLAKANGLDSETVLNLGIYCAMAGIGGAKLMMILVDLGDYVRNPAHALSRWPRFRPPAFFTAV